MEIIISGPPSLALRACMRIVFSLLSVLCYSTLALAEERQTVELRPDAHGDPLPPGAVARLGSIRLQPGMHIRHLAFSPDGKQLVSGSWSSVSIWEAATGRELRHVELPTASIQTLSWPADNRGVAVLGLNDGSFFLWNFADEKAERPASDPDRILPEENQENYFQFAVAPDGKRLAAARLRYFGTGQVESTIDLYDVHLGKSFDPAKKRHSLDPEPGLIREFAFSPDGKSLVGFSRFREREGHLVFWDVTARKGMNRSDRIPPLNSNGVFASSPDGRTLATGHNDGTVRLFDLMGTRKQRYLRKHAESTLDGKPVTAIAFSPDGKLLVTVGRDSSVRVWDVAKRGEIRVLDAKAGVIDKIVFSPDGKRIAAAGRDGLIRLWDARTGDDLSPTGGGRSWMDGVAISPDGKTAATAGDSLRFWDVQTGREMRKIAVAGRILYCAYTPDGKAVIAGPLASNRDRMWNAESGKPIALPGELAAVDDILHGFSTDGRTLLTAKDGIVTLWDWPVGRRRRTIELPHRKIEAMENMVGKLVVYCSLSPDGKVLITSGVKQYYHNSDESRTTAASTTLATSLWDAASGKLITRLTEHDAFNVKHVFLPDCRSFIQAGYGVGREGQEDAYQRGSLTWWDASSGKIHDAFALPREGWPQSRRQIEAIVLSPDGWTLATAEIDQIVLIYEVASRQVRRRLTGHRGEIPARGGTPHGLKSLAFTPDGKKLVTTCSDNTGLVWDLSLAGAAAKNDALTAKDREALWSDLANDDAQKAYEALARLAAAPEAALAIIQKHARPVQPPDEAAIARLIPDLDDDAFAVRERAKRELDRHGKQAIESVRKHLAIAKSEEIREHLRRFLDRFDKAAASPEELRQGRVLELLEQIDGAAARKILKELSNGSAMAWQTQRAAAALQRLERRN